MTNDSRPNPQGRDNSKRAGDRMAADIAASFGREAVLARANLGLTARAAARLAGVSPTTYAQVEQGAPTARLTSFGRVASALGLKLWGKAFPVRTPSLRDTGQLKVAETIRAMIHGSFRFAMELAMGNGRSIDVVLFGPMEILAIEIIRLLADFQAQYRAAIAKRDELAKLHQRPVRLVVVVEDTKRNRRVAAEHTRLIAESLPAGSRDVLRAVRTGSALGRDGLLWLRR